MFARSACIRLKPKSLVEFARVIENEAIPLLRRQKGFQDEITFVVPGGNEVIEINLWDRKEDADAYGRTAFRGAAKVLQHVTEGDFEVRTYAVSNSTFHKIAAPILG